MKTQKKVFEKIIKLSNRNAKDTIDETSVVRKLLDIFNIIRTQEKPTSL